ncbi:hypothetical protein QMK33_16700 [Hymenobacter sp. H14-R3]|uniref:hypothetical protein n=1 Tax=Hymenobacter sp. H14-R3 TaxID=3046308 RepID=UPI0024BB48CB|nr:hypothetical protein [Hymenobacter sp. H14-R3]MDJ0366795.1 hypothetical protein [Hymenobacter sp. H14-R3]
MMTRTFRLLAVAVALPSLLSACSDSPKPGSTNVEMGSIKGEYVSGHEGQPNGDSLAAGLTRDPNSQPTGKEVYKKAGQSSDKNHDGIAD